MTPRHDLDAVTALARSVSDHLHSLDESWLMEAP